MHCSKRWVIFWCCLVLAASRLFAAPPLKPSYLESKEAGFKPCRMLSQETVARMQKKGALRKAGKRGVIAKTTKTMLAIRVNFSGTTGISTSKTDTEVFFSKLQAYYRENSYGMFIVSTTVSANIYALSMRSRYNSETEQALLNLKNDAISKVLSDYPDLSDYDYLMIYHAGRGEEESGDSRDLWSLFYPLTFTAGGKSFDGFTVVPELGSSGYSPLAVICHEFGHQLGLPDLYNTSESGGSSTCGAWSVMDYPYGADNSGATPPHLDPWCRNYLQFIDLSSPAYNGSYEAITLGDIETSPATGYFRLPVSPTDDKEYFVAEYRHPDSSKVSFDLSLPGEGILIWHIDDTIALDATHLSDNDINNDSSHLGVDLVEADGTTSSYPPGSEGQAFQEGDSFTKEQSKTCSGGSTGIRLSSLRFSGNIAAAVAWSLGISSAAPAWGYAGSSENACKLTGSGFTAATRVRLQRSGQTDIYGEVSCSDANSLSCVFDLASAATGYWDIVVSTGVAGAAEETLTGGYEVRSSAVGASAGGSITVLVGQSLVTADIPEGTFSHNVTFTVRGTTAPAPGDDTLLLTDIVMEISAGGSQPSKEITIRIRYSPADVSGFDEAQLAIARYEPSLAKWVILPSSVDTANRIVTAGTGHLSLFALVQAVPAATLGRVVAFPNPFYPLRDVQGMTLGHLTGDAEISIYTVAGELVRKLRAGGGAAKWDGTNESGQMVASGVYLAVVKGQAGKKALKIAVIK